jgi:hypothetical protein
MKSLSLLIFVEAIHSLLSLVIRCAALAALGFSLWWFVPWAQFF